MSLLRQGLIGFSVLFTFVILTKLLKYYLIEPNHFTFESKDFYLAFLGFIFAVLPKIMQGYKGNKPFRINIIGRFRNIL